MILGPLIPVLLVACASRPASPAIEASGDHAEHSALVEARADWDDLDAAVSAVNERHALGTIERETDDAGVTYRLIDIRSRPIVVRFERRPRRVAIMVRAGRFGDSILARRIARDLALRLEQLYGVEIAPLDWSGGS